MIENTIVSPHLNAEAYKNDTSYFSSLSYLDYVKVHKDGTFLLGCSELTGRYWNGGVKIAKSITEIEDVKDFTTSISLTTGTADGCFIVQSDKVLLCEDSGALSVWSMGNNAWKQWEEVITVTEHDDSVLGVECLDPNVSYVTVGADTHIKIWDINEMICESNLANGHSRLISGVSVKSNSTQFVTCSMDRYVSMWDKNEKEKVNDLAILDCGAKCAQWFNDNTLLVGDEAGVIISVDVRNTNNTEKLITMPAPIHRITIQDESKMVAVSCDNNIVKVFESEANKLNEVYQSKHGNYVRGLCWDITDKNTLYTSSWDGTVKSHKIL